MKSKGEIKCYGKIALFFFVLKNLSGVNSYKNTVGGNIGSEQ